MLGFRLLFSEGRFLVPEEHNEKRLLDALNRILTAITGTHWHTRNSIEDLRKMLVRGVKAVAAAHRGIDKKTAEQLDSLSPPELDQLIDRLDLPAKFPDAKP